MAQGKVIFINGEAMELQFPESSLDNLLRGNYVYASVNCVGNRPLHLDRHMDSLRNSYQSLFGIRPSIGALRTLEHIQRLLYLNGATLGGNVVTVYLLPPEDFIFGDSQQPRIIIAFERTVMYGSGYKLSTLRPRTMVANYDIPFEQHRTSVSLTSSQYMDAFAAGRGANIAIRSTRVGNIVSCGDYPVFAVRDGKITVTPLGKGIGDSVERGLMFRACKMCGLDVEERETLFSELRDVDELVVFKNTGLISPLCIDSHYFTNLVSLRLEKVLPVLTEEGLAGYNG